MSKQNCYECKKVVPKDVIALNKKLLGKAIKKFLCLDCFSDYIGATTEDLLIKIEEFKEQGCALFK